MIREIQNKWEALVQDALQYVEIFQPTVTKDIKESYANQIVQKYIEGDSKTLLSKVAISYYS